MFNDFGCVDVVNPCDLASINELHFKEGPHLQRGQQQRCNKPTKETCQIQYMRCGFRQLVFAPTSANM